MRTFLIQVKPGSRQETMSDASTGLQEKGVRYVIRVTAKAEDGKANRAVEKLLARHFHIAMKNVSIASGTHSRVKRIRIDN